MSIILEKEAENLREKVSFLLRNKTYWYIRQMPILLERNGGRGNPFITHVAKNHFKIA